MWLIAQRITRAPMAVCVVSNLLQLLTFPLLIGHTSLGFDGAALSLTIKDVVQGVMLFLLYPCCLRPPMRASYGTSSGPSEPSGAPAP